VWAVWMSLNIIVSFPEHPSDAHNQDKEQRYSNHNGEKEEYNAHKETDK
jgi:hypothetical protein